MSVAIDQYHQPAVRHVINHDIMHCTAEGVIGNQLYSGRALGLSEPWDVIQLHPDLRPLWTDITAHYDNIGLRHSKHPIWHVDHRELGAHIGFHPSVFYFGPGQCRFWGDHDWLEAVEYINSKNRFMELAAELGIDVPQTRCFTTAREAMAADLQALPYPCYAKAAVSVSGVGIYRCENPIELAQALAKFDDDVPIQLQEEVTTPTFLNLQYRISGDRLERLVASEQILDGFVHQGNRVPARHEPWDAVEPMAEWLRDRGMKGVFAFDVAVVQTDEGPRFPAIECNPRFNGASYPTAIAEKLGIAEWTAVTFVTRHRALSAIDLTNIEFDPETGCGIIIVNWGPVLHGKLLIMLAGTSEQQAELRSKLEERL